MRISPKIPQLTLATAVVLVAGCPKSKTDATSARTEVSQLAADADPGAPAPESQTTKPAAPKPQVDHRAGTVTKPGKSEKGEDLVVSSTNVEIVQPKNPNALVVIEEAPVATPSATEPEVVEFPAVKLTGKTDTVVVGESAQAMLQSPMPAEAEAVVATDSSAPSQSNATDPSTQLDTDLGQPVGVSDVPEVTLSPNTSYTITFVEETTPVDVATVVTLAAPPKVASAEQQADGSIAIVIDPNGNPEGTLYSIAVILPGTGEIVAYVDASTGEILKEGESRYQTLTSSTLVIKGLQEDVELVTFAVQAQNQEGEATPWSDEIAVLPIADDAPPPATAAEPQADDEAPLDPQSVGIDPATATEADLKVRIDEEQAKLGSLKDQLKALKAKIDAIRKELKTKNAARRDILKKLRKSDKAQKGKPQDAAKLEAELDQIQRAIDEAGKKLRDVKAEIKNLKSQIKDQAAVVKKLKKVLNQMKKAAKAGGSRNDSKGKGQKK